MNPIPTKHCKELLKMPSSFPPRKRLISNDQMDSFRKRDTITTLADLNETTAPDGFQFKNLLTMHCLITWYLIKR